WQVGITTLMYERLALGFGLQARFEIATGATLDLARRVSRDGQPAAKDPIMRQRLAQLVIDNAVFKYTAKRAITKLLRGEMPGSEASAGKIWGGGRDQALQDPPQDPPRPSRPLRQGPPRAVGRRNVPPHDPPSP